MLSALLLAAAVQIPPENAQKGDIPPFDAAVEMAKRLLDAIQADDPKAVAGDFFPAEPFEVLKALPKPLDYHKQLTTWFDADIHKEHERVKALGKLAFVSFRAGGCKWKAINTETNKIAYWSCYGNKFAATGDGGKKVDFGLRAMINWGKTWYVTHLLPLPKS